jgi:uncharacterized membrane protein YeiH
VDSPSPGLIVALDLAGVFVFAISGGLVAVRKSLDVVGILTLAVITGLGGGFLRDLLIGAVPPAALTATSYLVVPIVAGLLCFRFHPTLGRMERLVVVFDAAGLGLFCSTGALKAIAFGLGPLQAALLGMISGIGGGILRDVLAVRVPVVLRRELYATPALAGAALAVLLDRLGLPLVLVAIPAAVACFGWRMIAVRRGWHGWQPEG